jgi:hypothetical protein
MLDVEATELATGRGGGAEDLCDVEEVESPVTVAADRAGEAAAASWLL